MRSQTELAQLPQKAHRLSEVAVCKSFIFCLITLSVFREKIYVGDGYVKLMELYIGICLPLIVLIFAWNIRAFFAHSVLFVILLFGVFFFMDWLSGKVCIQYISQNERFLYILRLGFILVMTMVLLVSLSSKYPLLIGSAYKGFLVAGILIILWIVFFPQVKTSLRRFTGPIGDPNYTAAFLIISTNIAVYWALVTPNRVWRILYATLGIVFFATIVVSLSRGGLLGATISLVFLLQVVVISKNQFIYGILLVKKQYFKRAAIGIIMVILTIGLIAVSHPKLTDSFIKRLSIERIRNQEDQMRQDLWKLGIRSIAERPVGYGMGQMRAKHRLLDPEHKQFGHSSEVHNTILQIGGAFGWPGMSLFVIFLFVLFRVCLKILQRKRYVVDSAHTYPIPLITSGIGLFVQSMLFNFLFLKYFWMIAALVLSYYEYQKRQNTIRSHHL